jgi:cysteate synthase
MVSKYYLQCYLCGRRFTDDGLLLSACDDHPPALLRTVYSKSTLEPGPDSLGLFKFSDWMPVRRFLRDSSAPVTYRSGGLAARLGLRNLFITFSGFWPERGALFETCTFKELEAYAVCARLPENFDGVLVVASAGNTARAFARVCSDNGIRLLLVVPSESVPMLWHTGEIADCIKVVAGENCDYTDAITLADLICSHAGFVPEGGVKNVARRDGLGTTVLSAVTAIGQIPDEYFQAVGSGTGAIAAWEENERLVNSGVFGNKRMRLNVSQNAPFTPICESWDRRSRELVYAPIDARSDLERVYARVLANRQPPYGIIGGLYDALVTSAGTAHSITNDEARFAASLFLETEGIDIDPAAAVAVASLVRCARDGAVRKDALIMLNVTGGGMERLRQERKIGFLKANAVVAKSEFHRDRIMKIVQPIAPLPAHPRRDSDLCG